MKKAFLGLFVAAALAPAAAGQILSDNFDGYADQAAFQAAWTPIGANSATLASDQSHSAPNSVFALTTTNNTGGNYRNLPGEYNATDGAPLLITYWMYYANGGTRHYNEIRAYADGGFGQGALQQLVAAGWNNSVTAPGEVFDGTKFQARVAFGPNTGWFNLNAAGAPNRSEGWHKFTIEIRSTDLNVYVDDVLGRTFTRGAVASFDSFVLGSRLTSAGVGSWTDDLVITPEPGALALLALGGLAALRRR
jgi:hypothetical protein